MKSVSGLDWIPGDVAPIRPGDPNLKIPHMGWNTLDVALGSHPALAGISTGEKGLHAYFVHSFQLYPSQPSGHRRDRRLRRPVTAIVARDNLIGTHSTPRRARPSVWP